MRECGVGLILVADGLERQGAHHLERDLVAHPPGRLDRRQQRLQQGLGGASEAIRARARVSAIGSCAGRYG